MTRRPRFTAALRRSALRVNPWFTAGAAGEPPGPAPAHGGPEPRVPGSVRLRPGGDRCWSCGQPGVKDPVIRLKYRCPPCDVSWSGADR